MGVLALFRVHNLPTYVNLHLLKLATTTSRLPQSGFVYKMLHHHPSPCASGYHRHHGHHGHGGGHHPHGGRSGHSGGHRHHALVQSSQSHIHRDQSVLAMIPHPGHHRPPPNVLACHGGGAHHGHGGHHGGGQHAPGGRRHHGHGSCHNGGHHGPCGGAHGGGWDLQGHGGHGGGHHHSH